ncbi:MAG: hypothetical protein IKH04_02600 [Kiritimatiellae bacterium]|nr:hypothetical protein [Kiritimatiellia bacterium]
MKTTATASHGTSGDFAGRHFARCALAIALAAPLAALAVRNEGGEFTYGGAVTDMRTTGQTGDQIWNVTSPLSIKNFWPGQTDDVPYWQIYRGESITDSGQARVMRGNVVFENEVKWTGTENYVGLLGLAKIVLRNGGSLTVTGDHLRIGQKDTSGAAGAGMLFMEEPSALTVVGKIAIAGNSRPGTIWMDGGTLSVTNNKLATSSSANIEGYIRVNGGTVSLGADNADFLQIGRADNYGSMHVSGGKVSTRRAGLPAYENLYAWLGYATKTAPNKAADIYVDGGLFDFWNEGLGIGYWSDSGVTGGRATLTVDGDARFVGHMVFLGRTGSGNTASVNLNGGRFELTRGFSEYKKTGNNSQRLNFDGGTLALVRDSRTTAYTGALGTAAGDISIYPGGGTIEVPSGITANVSATFRKATGWGVSEITLTSPGSGYVTAPKVTISGGSGSGATAYAILNKDMTLERIAVTCRGEGYAEGDAVTVTIASGTGSGAAATATLAPNDGGVLRKTGAGTWRQQTNDNAFDGAIEVAEGTLAVSNAAFTAASALRMGEGTAVAPVRGSTSALNRLDVTNGVVAIAASGSSGTATLTIGELSVNQGLALVTHTNGLDIALSSTDSTATSSAESPVVNGLVYANKDAGAFRSPSLFERAADGSLSLVTTTATPGTDANWMPSADSTFAATALNSIIMPLSGGGLNCYVENSGLVEVKSGMMVVRRPNEGVQRMNVTGGGAFTTRARDGFFIYGDTYLAGKRSNSTADGNAVDKGEWRRLFGPFADPDSSTPMALTVAGEKQTRPELGFQAWFLGGNNSFSGGLNLVNGGVFIEDNSGLGAAGALVRASGYCSIAARDWAFAIAHPIALLDGSALIFSPSARTGNTVSGALSGSGDLLTSDINRPGYAVAFTGDHSAFTGDYYIQGSARIAPAAFSAAAGIKLADGTNGVGVVETSGAFTRPAGTGKGEVCWKRFGAYPVSYGLRGGFAAFGGDLTVNLGGAGAKLVPGADYLPTGAVIQLQSQFADGALTFANGFALGGRTQKVSVWQEKTATLAGAISDEVGGGALAVDGDIAFAGTLEFGAATAAANSALLAVDGDLDFASGASVAVDPAALAELDSESDYAIATATGAITGVPALDAASDAAGWHVAVKRGAVVLRHVHPFVMVVR